MEVRAPVSPPMSNATDDFLDDYLPPALSTNNHSARSFRRPPSIVLENLSDQQIQELFRQQQEQLRYLQNQLSRKVNGAVPAHEPDPPPPKVRLASVNGRRAEPDTSPEMDPRSIPTPSPSTDSLERTPRTTSVSTTSATTPVQTTSSSPARRSPATSAPSNPPKRTPSLLATAAATARAKDKWAQMDSQSAAKSYPPIRRNSGSRSSTAARSPGAAPSPRTPTAQSPKVAVGAAAGTRPIVPVEAFSSKKTTYPAVTKGAGSAVSKLVAQYQQKEEVARSDPVQQLALLGKEEPVRDTWRQQSVGKPQPQLQRSEPQPPAQISIPTQPSPLSTSMSTQQQLAQSSPPRSAQSLSSSIQPSPDRRVPAPRAESSSSPNRRAAAPAPAPAPAPVPVPVPAPVSVSRSDSMLADSQYSDDPLIPDDVPTVSVSLTPFSTSTAPPRVSTLDRSPAPLTQSATTTSASASASASNLYGSLTRPSIRSSTAPRPVVQKSVSFSNEGVRVREVPHRDDEPWLYDDEEEEDGEDEYTDEEGQDGGEGEGGEWEDEDEEGEDEGEFDDDDGYDDEDEESPQAPAPAQAQRQPPQRVSSVASGPVDTTTPVPQVKYSSTRVGADTPAGAKGQRNSEVITLGPAPDPASVRARKTDVRPATSASYPTSSPAPGGNSGASRAPQAASFGPKALVGVQQPDDLSGFLPSRRKPSTGTANPRDQPLAPVGGSAMPGTVASAVPARLVSGGYPTPPITPAGSLTGIKDVAGRGGQGARDEDDGSEGYEIDDYMEGEEEFEEGEEDEEEEMSEEEMSGSELDGTEMDSVADAAPVPPQRQYQPQSGSYNPPPRGVSSGVGGSTSAANAGATLPTSTSTSATSLPSNPPAAISEGPPYSALVRPLERRSSGSLRRIPNSSVARKVSIQRGNSVRNSIRGRGSGAGDASETASIRQGSIRQGSTRQGSIRGSARRQPVGGPGAGRFYQYSMEATYGNNFDEAASIRKAGRWGRPKKDKVTIWKRIKNVFTFGKKR